MNPNLPAHMLNDEPPDDACIDADGNEWPEHDFPPVGWGNECRRCGALADDTDDLAFEAQEEAEKAEDLDQDGEETTEGLDARLRDGVRQLLAATEGHEFPPEYAERLLAKATETVTEADRIIIEAQEQGR